MKRKREIRLVKFAEIIFMIIMLLLADMVIVGIILLGSHSTYSIGSQELISHLHLENGIYQLDEEETEILLNQKQFAMLLDNDGTILWSESLPEELEKHYTMQDVARFSRYYLEDYPIHTYVASQGLLVIGERSAQVWKYNLEYDVKDLLTLVKVIPLLLVLNIVVLITVPAYLQKRRSKQKEEERTEWIAGVSHDIRTPLAIVLGNAEMIADSAEEAELKQKAELIEQQGLRLRRLVENLNLSSKLEFGSGKFEKKKVQVSRFLRKTLTEIMNQTENEAYQFALEIDECLQDLTMDINEDLAERMVVNLVYNAIRHNADGCNIEILLHEERKKHVLLEISDDGKGMTEDLLKKLNQKNYEWEPGSGQHGLGLKIVKQVADWHRWKICFAQGEHGGLVCSIRLR